MMQFQKPQVWGGGVKVCKDRSNAAFACFLNWFREEGLQSWGPRGREKLSVCISDSWLLQIKHLRSVRQEGVVLVHSPGHRSSWWGSQGSQSVRWPVTLHPLTGRRERRMMVLMAFLSLFSLKSKPHGMVPPTHSGYSLAQSAFLIVTHLVSMVILNLVKLATKISYILSPLHLTAALTSKGATRDLNSHSIMGFACHIQWSLKARS